MVKKSEVKLRTQTELKEHWQQTARTRSISLSELVHLAMKKECGLSPFEIETMKNKTK